VSFAADEGFVRGVRAGSTADFHPRWRISTIFNDGAACSRNVNAEQPHGLSMSFLKML
jgi:hypothetical protein